MKENKREQSFTVQYGRDGCRNTKIKLVKIHIDLMRKKQKMI